MFSRRSNRLFRKRGRRPTLPLSLILFGLFVFLLWLVPTYESGPLSLPALQSLPTLTLAPSLTPPPTPTSVHGGQIVFTCQRRDYNQICLVNADGSGYRQLTDAFHNSYYPAISPDGSAVVFATNQGDTFDLFLLTLSNKKLVQLTQNIGNAFGPRFSPDGQQILFLNSVNQQPPALWVMGRMGEAPHLLYAGSGPIVAAEWSPDGQRIAFAMPVDRPFAYEIFLLDLAHPDQAPRRLTYDLPDIGGSLDWSPDGSNLLIYAGPVNGREIFRLEISNGAISQLTFGGNNAAAAYSPDGQYIVYNSLRNNNQADLFIMRADGHSTRQLTNNPEPEWQPQWGP